jgi:trehalose/maltose hydrolase-like predicted phosphorylase
MRTTGDADGAPALVDSTGSTIVEHEDDGENVWYRVAGEPGGVAIAATQSERPAALERLAAYTTSSHGVPSLSSATHKLARARAAGFDRLLAEHRHAWARRWETADVIIEGDPELQQAVRFALFHLMASVPDRGEAAVGARGISGRAYRGHVFWDSDVFVLPFLAATHPPAARAMLEYRVRRLAAAQAHAARMGRRGARFPWESAHEGIDVTPTFVYDKEGRVVPIRTGQLEEHITADVAWAASFYCDWTADRAFEFHQGRALLEETARYWASRARLDQRDGRAHIYGVIGPDEYHEPVDDNAFTNVMARWNLERAAALPGTDGRERDERLRIARALVDGYDPATGVYEQFSGFYDLEPLIIADVAPRRPITADVFLGRPRVQRSQVLKQADVLMLHHLVPDAVEPGTLEPNLAFYEPRTAHGSSLSPAIHASLFARVGKLAEAVDLLRTSSRLDLDDATSTTAEGLHLATMGGLWQALAFGFAGVRVAGDAVVVDPRLPDDWKALELRLRFRGSPLRLRIEPDAFTVQAAHPIPLAVGDEVVRTGRGGVRFRRRGRGWVEAR